MCSVANFESKFNSCMASGFFAVLDDISVLMDDVITMSKVATKKTSGILGDDLAVNAEKATGFVSSRELPILWKISLGSLLNKAIILPITFLLSYFAPQVITPILLAGGGYLAYEGVEKIIHALQGLFKKDSSSTPTRQEAKVASEPTVSEEEKVKSAIFVDFILSIEIVIIALSTVTEEPLLTQVIVVSVVAFLATVGVYGIVALIVRMDDFGLVLLEKDNALAKSIGRILIKGLPLVIKALSVIGTIALLLVSGGIFHHNVEFVHHVFEWVPALVVDFLTGIIVGLVLFPVVHVLGMLKGLFKK